MLTEKKLFYLRRAWKNSNVQLRRIMGLNTEFPRNKKNFQNLSQSCFRRKKENQSFHSQSLHRKEKTLQRNVEATIKPGAMEENELEN